MQWTWTQIDLYKLKKLIIKKNNTNSQNNHYTHMKINEWTWLDLQIRASRSDKKHWTKTPVALNYSGKHENQTMLSTSLGDDGR